MCPDERIVFVHDFHVAQSQAHPVLEEEQGRACGEVAVKKGDVVHVQVFGSNQPLQ
jgi:hypothetical protein